ncbi:MAG: PhzF family phenazine biosynthesis protein [Bacteroidales bacterium]|nr:PhzF family phenazine biosynthesis protein [Bacteroidales bacterium]
MKFFIVDAFTDRPFGGNPAGVVLLEGKDYPEERLMLLVAAELRFSETAFVRQDAGREFTLRYFTPKAEVELCGHATIASFHLLHQRKNVQGNCLCHTLAGDLTIEAGPQVLMQMAAPRIVSTLSETDIAAAYRAVGAKPTALRPQIVYAGLPDIMLPVATLEELNALQPDMKAVSDLTKRLNAVSIHAFVQAGDGYTAHVRDFAPLYGVPEESATGTANAALTCFLAQNMHVSCPGDYRFLQGEVMGRPSVITTRLKSDGTLYVGGTAAIVAEGNILID